jgi:hypothetical protein
MLGAMVRPVLLVTLSLLCACGGGKAQLVTLGGVVLADAFVMDELDAAEQGGPLVELGKDGKLPALPAGATVVRIAAHRDAPYGSVRELVRQIARAGARPVLLVGRLEKIGKLPAGAVAESTSILLEAEEEGKSCVSPPGAEERLCSKAPYGPHTDRAGVRELVRNAIKGYGIHAVHVRPDLSMSWVDAVRAIDGARDCCDQAVEVRVSVEDLPI